MAAIPSGLADEGRRSSSSSRRAGLSYGRGGAGNMAHGPTTADVDPVDLETPTIKSDVYTTGRGGSGNMSKNTDPFEARRAQDVVAWIMLTETSPPRRESESDTHVGRGGAANVFRRSDEEVAAAKRENASWESAIADTTRGRKEMGFADKGKEWLFGKKR